MNQRDCKKCVYYGGNRKGKAKSESMFFCLNDKMREGERPETAGKETDMEVKLTRKRNQKLYRVNDLAFLDLGRKEKC